VRFGPARELLLLPLEAIREKENPMIARWLATALFCVIAASVGCDRAKNPAEVRKDVSEAQQDANKQIADARSKAVEEAAEARRDVGNQVEDSSEKVADANREVAMARIDGEHEIATQRCEALEGDAQHSCKAAADADYDLAKRRVDNTFKN
jgi:hypothetical protein